MNTLQFIHSVFFNIFSDKRSVPYIENCILPADRKLVCQKHDVIFTKYRRKIIGRYFDGNKRIGTHAMLVFLDINNITLSYEDDDLIAAILRVASGNMNDSELLEWLKTHIE